MSLRPGYQGLHYYEVEIRRLLVRWLSCSLRDLQVMCTR